MEFQKKRLRCMIVTVWIELLSGFVYGWSVFQLPLCEKYGWSGPAVSMAYTVNCIVPMFISLFGGKIRQQMTIKQCVRFGCILYGGGIFLCGFLSGDVWQLYLYYGVFNGIGLAFIYPVLTSYAIELYPDYQGRAGGIATAAYGLSALLWAPLATWIFGLFGDISYSFWILGGMFFISIFLLSFFLEPIPKAFSETIFNKTQKKQNQSVSIYEITKKQMLHSPIFFAVYFSLFIGLSCGSMVITQGSPIAQNKFGFTAQQAGMVVGFMSLTSALGRLIWGIISDKIGKSKTVCFIHGVIILTMFLLLKVSYPTGYIGCMLLSSFCFGGFACIVAPITSALFGMKHITENYSIMFTVFGVSSIFGPLFISAVQQISGNFEGAFLVGAVGCMIGLFFMLYVCNAVAKQCNKVKRKNQTYIDNF